MPKLKIYIRDQEVINTCFWGQFCAGFYLYAIDELKNSKLNFIDSHTEKGQVKIFQVDEFLYNSFGDKERFFIQDYLVTNTARVIGIKRHTDGVEHLSFFAPSINRLWQMTVNGQNCPKQNYFGLHIRWQSVELTYKKYRIKIQFSDYELDMRVKFNYPLLPL